MDAVDIYNGIARAVEAAKPAQEYCFFWIPHWSTCLTKSEWASWIQAFGILSFLYGPWILSKLRRKRLKRALEDIKWKIYTSKKYADSAYKHLEKNCVDSSYKTASWSYVYENIRRLEDIDEHAISVVEVFNESIVRKILEFNRLKGEIWELSSIDEKTGNLDFYTLMDIEIKCAQAAACLDMVEVGIEFSQHPVSMFFKAIKKALEVLKKFSAK
ncbi:hypothetical protein [Delftia acidovorans]|uniref:hypothetical protein n=1 Tax=Delftia acidovorans TaxID=80866 RepID=UPI0012FE7D88|nr:hypothetical protein [Delftia acidovorans]